MDNKFKICYKHLYNFLFGIDFNQMRDNYHGKLVRDNVNRTASEERAV